MAVPMVAVHLYGKHSHRIPLAYAPYRRAVQDRISFVASPKEAQILLLGFKKDLVVSADAIRAARQANPGLRIVILSEEPLWDSLWSGDFLTNKQTYGHGADPIPFWFLNHANSDIFKFQTIPYFLTTNTDFLVRYASLFTRNAALTVEDILRIWQRANIKRAYYLQRRTTPNYGVANEKAKVRGLCLFRSRMAELDDAQGVVRVGQGWSEAPRRQDRPDWHLEKLAALDRSTQIVCAIENTHAPDYVTETIFDAFAVLGIPVYHAGPDHALHRVVAEGTYIDVFGLTADEAVGEIRQFQPTREFATKYLETQKRLADLFCDTASYQRERERVADAIIQELSAVVAEQP
jgi:hypothetical protein